VLAVESDDDFNSDSASCFLNLLLDKSETCPSDLKEIFAELLPSVEYIVFNQKKFDADVDIYGDFHEIYSSIRTNIDMT